MDAVGSAQFFVETGHYGRLLDGQPAPGGLEASPVVTLPIALSFQVFGVGLWQGRLVSLVCAAAAITLQVALAARMYDQTAAWGTLGVLLLLPVHPQLSALLTGRQVLGEMPMLLFLIGGYLCLDAALRGRALWIMPAAVFWSLALFAKAQTFPFWLVSLAGATGMALLLRRWRAAAIMTGGMALTFLARPWVTQIVTLPIAGRTLPGTAISGIYEVTAFVLNPMNRLFALQMILIGGLPALLGLSNAAWRFLHDARAARTPDHFHDTLVMRAAILGLAGGWFAWFALLSVGVPRYLFPAVFTSAMFTAALLRDLTGGFRPGFVVEHLVAPLRMRRLTRQSAGVWLATLLVATALPLTLLSYWRHFTADERAVFSRCGVSEHPDTAGCPDRNLRERIARFFARPALSLPARSGACRTEPSQPAWAGNTGGIRPAGGTSDASGGGTICRRQCALCRCDRVGRIS